jgi:hypothetical protein
MIRFNKELPVVRLLVLALAGLVIAGVPLRAQATAGSISGVVQDAQGAVVPAAKVTLTNENQGAASARTVNTTGDGTFVFTPVLAGKYSVTVEMTGFKKYSQSGISLDVNDKLGLPTIALQVGATGESVTVEAAAVQLQTLSGERAGVVNAAQVVDIAINGRNYTSLLKTVPGIAADSGAGDVSSNGGRTAQNNFTLDGRTSQISVSINSSPTASVWMPSRSSRFPPTGKLPNSAVTTARRCKWSPRAAPGIFTATVTGSSAASL